MPTGIRSRKASAWSCNPVPVMVSAVVASDSSWTSPGETESITACGDARPVSVIVSTPRAASNRTANVRVSPGLALPSSVMLWEPVGRSP